MNFDGYHAVITNCWHLQLIFSNCRPNLKHNVYYKIFFHILLIINTLTLYHNILELLILCSRRIVCYYKYYRTKQYKLDMWQSDFVMFNYWLYLCEYRRVYIVKPRATVSLNDDVLSDKTISLTRFWQLFPKVLAKVFFLNYTIVKKKKKYGEKRYSMTVNVTIVYHVILSNA